MSLVTKPDFNLIFASQAPSVDLPPQFNNYVRGMDETRKNNGKPTIKQFNYLHQNLDLKLLWILQNGAALPYDSSIEYAENSLALKDGELQQFIDGVWSPYKKPVNASDVKDESGLSQQAVNDSTSILYAALYLKGDGSDEKTQLLNLINLADTKKATINLCGLTVTTSALSLSLPLRLEGRGGIKLKSGSNTTLISSSSDIYINGDITLDSDLLNNSGGTLGDETHCTIKHSGDNLILKGVKVKASASMNVVSRATGKIICRDLDVDGGRVCLYLVPRPNVKVDVIGGTYKNSTKYDNVAVIDGEDVNIRGVTSHSASRSGIVVSNATKSARIIGNYCYNNKIDTVNQGGWGIVTSVNTQDSIVANNTCKGNERGGITLDVYATTFEETKDARLVATGNVVDGEYNGDYSTSGISLNGAMHSIVANNNIRKVRQGIHTENAQHALIVANIVQNVRNYFVAVNLAHGAIVADNVFDGLDVSVSSVGAIQAVNTDNFLITSNSLRNLKGSYGIAIRVSGASKDWNIDGNKITRSEPTGGSAFSIVGAENTGGVIQNNTVTAKVAGALQWCIVGDNSAQFSAFNNVFNGIGTGVSNYIYQGANVTAGDNTVNGLKNYYATAPSFKSRVGQIAVIGDELKFWDGTAWV